MSMASALQRAAVWCFGGWCAGFGLWGAGRTHWCQAWHDKVVDTVVVRAELYSGPAAAKLPALDLSEAAPLGTRARLAAQPRSGARSCRRWSAS
jgi:hypothetical protein